MSKETDMLRKFASGCNENDIPSFLNLHGLRDRVAFAIEAVEAQVAEAVARVEKLEAKFVTTTDKIEPAPSAAPSPRGFKRGDVVRTGGLSPFDAVVVEVREPQRENWNVTIKADRGTYKWHGPDLTLVRAAAAPEAPAEAPTTRPTPAMELDALRGEVARLTAERDDWKYAAEVQKKDMEGWKARAEAADIRADGHAEGLRSIRKMLTQSPPDVDRAILWCDDSLSGYTQSVAATEAETNDRALAAEARAEAAEKDRDTWKSEAEQRLKTLKFEGARAEALAKDLAEARAISAATAERVRTETQIATELRKELADANGARDRLVRELSGERVERDYWKIRAEDVTKEWDALRAELSALKAKPRFRTRKVTKADVEDLIAHDGCFYESLRALGFRRRVDGAK